MIFTVERELALTVEVVNAERGTPGGRWEAPEPECIELRVCLGTLDITAAVPGELLVELEADARERLEDAGAEP